MIDGDGGDCGGGDSIGAGGSGSDAGIADHPTQARPIDERPKINGQPVTDTSREIVIKKNHAQD